MEISVGPHYTIYNEVLTQRNTLFLATFLHPHIEIIWTYKNPQLQILMDIFRTTGVKAVHANKQLEIIGLNDTQITNDTD